MFAPKIDKPQTKAVESSSSRPAPRRSTFFREQDDHEPFPEALWDFGKISLFPTDRTSPAQSAPGLPHRPVVVQPKLVVGDVDVDADDPLEREADRAAQAAMAMGGSARLLSGEASALGGNRAASSRSAPDAGSVVSGLPPVAGEGLRSAGQLLDPETRSFFEKAYRHDFGHVRIHAGLEAAESAAALSARAYTAGSHIVLGEHPHAKPSRRLLAHELAHVVQQGGAAPLRALGASSVTVKSRVPLIQRQPLTTLLGGNWTPERVKPIVKDKDKTPGHEIWSVVEKNDLKGTPSLVRSAVIEGKRHEWKITIQAQKGGTATVPGPAGHTGKITSPQGNMTVHTVPVTVNTILRSSEEEVALFPFATPAKPAKAAMFGKPAEPAQAAQPGKDVERVNFMAARTLYHEVMHALIAIDSELPANEKRSQATKKYEDLRARAANAPAVIAAKQAVMSTISAMVTNAESTIGVPDLFDPKVTTPYPSRENQLTELTKSNGLDKIIGPEAVKDAAAATSGPMNHPSVQRRMFLEDSIETLISEKNARQETGKAFGLQGYASNKRTAEEYVKEIPETIQDFARRRDRNYALNLRTSDVWKNAEQTLQTQVEMFFAKLDQPSIEEFTPDLKSASPTEQPEPARLKP